MNAEENQKAEFCRLLNDYQAANERGDVQAMESLAAQLLSVAASEQARNPSKDLHLRQEASECANAGRWEQAEAAYRRALALAETEGNHAMLFKSHSDLSSLHQIRGMSDCALQEAKAAVDAARKSNVATLLSVALGDLSRCHLMNGDLTAAAATAEEAVQNTPADKMHDVQRARALVVRARCRVEQRQLSDAQRDLDGAWKLLSPLAEASMFSGVQGGLASWWEVNARIRTESNDPAGAAEAMGKAVEFRRTVSQMPQLDGPHKFFWLANTLQKYSVALMSAGNPDAAIRAFDESRVIYLKIGASVPGTSKV